MNQHQDLHRHGIITYSQLKSSKETSQTRRKRNRYVGKGKITVTEAGGSSSAILIVTVVVVVALFKIV